MKNFQAAIALLRPSHWVKNVFVLAGAFFAGHAFQLPVLRNVLLAFASFCLASSAVYALNDILDRHADARHPRKRFRPVASGKITVSAAIALSLACAVAALQLAGIVGRALFGLILVYLVVNTAYSRWLKHIVLVDVFCIASGFILRLLAGTLGVGIPPSQWFMLCTFLLSLFLGFSKRYAEGMEDGRDASEQRVVLEDYSPELLRLLLAVTLACTLMAYGLYTMSPSTLAVHGTGKLIYTLPIAAFVMFRYLYLVVQRGFGENLAGELLRDRGILVGILAYLAVTGSLLF
jgi:4-hydroxybenzoate polyprenyltransferase